MTLMNFNENTIHILMYDIFFLKLFLGNVKERGYYSAQKLFHVNLYTANKVMKLTNLHLTKFG